MTSVHENDFLRIHVLKLANSRARFTCEVKPSLTIPLKQKAIDDLQETNVNQNLENSYAQIVTQFDERVKQKWKELIILKVMEEALKLSSLTPVKLGNVKVDPFEMNVQDGCMMTFELDVLPIIPSINYSKLKKPKVKKREVTALDVQLEIEKLRFKHAVWLDLPKRPVIEGDFVVLEVIDLVTQKKIVDQQIYQVSDKVIAPWIYSKLIGMESNDSFEDISQIDPRAPDNVKAAFKPHPCKVTLCGVKQVILPEYNSEFHRKVGVQTFNDLQEKTKKQLEALAENEYNANVERDVIEQLGKAHPFEIPISLLENQKNALLERNKGNPSSQTNDAMLKNYAENLVRAHLLCSKLASEESIQISSDEIFSFLDKNLPQNSRNILYDSNLQEQKQHLLMEVANHLMYQRALQIVLSKIKENKSNRPIFV